MRRRHPRAEQLYQAVGVRVRDIRIRRGETQEGLAKRIRSARTTITNLEKGNQALPLHQLLAIAEALEVEIQDLVPTRADLAVAEATPLEIRRVNAPKTAELITSLLTKREENENG